MDSEICIPTNRVPPEILQKLKEIGLLLQSESIPPTSSSLLSLTSPSPSRSSRKGGDECDDLAESQKHPVVHVLSPEKKDSDVVSLFDKLKDSDVVSLFDKQKDSDFVSSFEQKATSDIISLFQQKKDSDVVSLFEHLPKDAPKVVARHVSQETCHGQWNEGVFSGRSTPLKEVVNQNSRSLQPQPHPGATQTVSPVCSQSSQQFATKLFSGHTEVSDHYTVPSQNLHRSSPVQALCGQEADEERRIVNNRSPCKPAKRYEDSARLHHSSFNHLAHSPATSEATSTAITATTSSSSQSSRSRTPPPQQPCSNDDDFLQGYPAGCVTPSKDTTEKSPKVLTPPETPEKDGKREVPKVFTFDDLACTQERFRQTCERLHKLQDQFTPTKRSPSTPRHPPSTPTTPSYRRQEMLPSPSVRRISPVDQHFLQRMEAVAAVSPQAKMKSEVPSSPAPTMQPTPQRLSVEEYSPQRRDTLSPKPKKRLIFDEEGVSSQLLQTQRLRTYDPCAGPYPIPSPRASGSGSENPFTFQPYAGDGQHFGRGTPSKSALTMAELPKRMTSFAAFQDERHVEEDDDEDERGGLFFSGTRRVYESIDFQNRMAMQNGRYTPKRKRPEPMDDGSDGMAICACAVMERNFLQMAECAYKRIRRIDATPADFDRFRNELAQTNEILRESMGLMKHIRDLCDHRKRPRW